MKKKQANKMKKIQIPRHCKKAKSVSNENKNVEHEFNFNISMKCK